MYCDWKVDRSPEITSTSPTPYSLSFVPRSHSWQTQARPSHAEPSRGTSHQLKPTPWQEDWGRWSPLSSMGRGKLGLPARTSKLLSLQHSLTAPHPPGRSAGPETPRVVGEHPPRSGSTGQRWEQPRMMPAAHQHQLHGQACLHLGEVQAHCTAN